MGVKQLAADKAVPGSLGFERSHSQELPVNIWALQRLSGDSRKAEGGRKSKLLTATSSYKPRCVHHLLTPWPPPTWVCVLFLLVSQLHAFLSSCLNHILAASLGCCFRPDRWVIYHICTDSLLVNFPERFLKKVFLTLLLFIGFQWWQVEKVNPIKLYEENKVIAGFSLLNLLFKQNRGGLIKGVMDKLLNLYNSKKIKPVVDSLWALEEVGPKSLSSFWNFWKICPFRGKIIFKCFLVMNVFCFSVCA